MTAPSMSTPFVWDEPCVPIVRADGSPGQISLLDHLYNRLDGLYPGRWRNNHPTPAALAAWRASWAEGFVADGVQPRELRTGVDACRRLYDWPPSYREFLRACRPWADPDNAYHEAVLGMTQRLRGERGQWSHPAVYWAAVRVGRHDILAHGYQVMRSRWQSALAEVLAQGQWPPVPAPADALAAPGNLSLTREQARAHLAALGAQHLVAQCGDPRRWIARTLERAARGERVSLGVLQRARQAAAELGLSA